MKYKVVQKKNHLFVMALFDDKPSADKYLTTTLPGYIAIGFLDDKKLKATDFEVILNEQNSNT